VSCESHGTARSRTSPRDDFANRRIHEVTGRVPALVFEHDEKPKLKPLPQTPFNTDDVLGTGVTKMCRVPFDRNHYSVPWRLVAQQVIVRADDERVAVFLEKKCVALHPRCWQVGQDISDPAHRQGLLDQKPRARAGSLPPPLVGLREVGREYFKLLSAGSRSIHRETVRLTLLIELFGEGAVQSAASEVMRTGHVGAEYLEYVLRHKRGLAPQPPPLRLGDETLDRMALREPDLAIYDDLVSPHVTRDPGSVPDDPTKGSAS
jgi:hypothetical protein